MSSHHDAYTYFPPQGPNRTSTNSSQQSQQSQLSGAASGDLLLPNTHYSHHARVHPSASPIPESFFGAISSKIRNRSRSNSRNRPHSSRQRSKSPMMIPPERLPPSSSAMPTTPTYAPHYQYYQYGGASTGPATPASPSTSTTRYAPQSQNAAQPRTRISSSHSSGDMWRGRHANSWLFNDFSVRDKLHITKKSS